MLYNYIFPSPRRIRRVSTMEWSTRASSLFISDLSMEFPCRALSSRLLTAGSLPASVITCLSYGGMLHGKHAVHDDLRIVS